MRPRLIFFISLFALSSFGYAQEAQKNDSTKTKVVKKTAISSNIQKEELGTNESIKYMGSKLWFQMRKRLNLTSKEEEEAEIKKSKKVTLSFGSIKIEG